MVYEEVSEDMNLKPDSWSAAIVFSILIGVLSIAVIVVWDVLIYQQINIGRTLQSGLLFIVLLALIIKSGMSWRKKKRSVRRPREPTAKHVHTEIKHKHTPSRAKKKIKRKKK